MQPEPDSEDIKPLQPQQPEASQDFQVPAVPENIGAETNYATPNQMAPLAVTAAKAHSQAWPWWKIVVAIATLVILFSGAYYFFKSGGDVSKPFALSTGECSADITKDSVDIKSLEEVSGCVKAYVNIVPPSQSKYSSVSAADFHAKVTYKFNALPGVDPYDNKYGSTSNIVSYTSKASPGAFGRISYSVTKESLDGPQQSAGKSAPDMNKLFTDEVSRLQKDDKANLERFIEFNDYTKISVSSEKKKISNKTYLITSRSTYSWGKDKKITAHNDVQRVVSMQAVKFTTQEKSYLTNGPATVDYERYELELLNMSVKAEHLIDSLYKQDKDYLDQIAEKMTRNISISLEMVNKDASMELIK